jgi:phage gp36-like protein
MPDYVLIGDLDADLPPQFLVQALDDDNDGIADAGIWTKVLKSVSEEIDGILGQKFAVPFGNPLPAIAVHAARQLAIAKLYQRRGIEDKANPYAKAAADIREKLKAIAQGKEPLAPELQQSAPSVSIISDKSKLHSSTGKNTI